MSDYDRHPEGYDSNPDDLQPAPAQDPESTPAPTPAAQTTHAGGSVTATTVYCIQCGYNLTGVAIGSHCPECGRLVVPSFHSPTLPTSGKAVASMVLGICSIAMCMFYGLPALICGPLAIAFSIMAKKQVERGEAGGASTGLATAGMVCGIVGLLLALLFIGFIVFAIVAGNF